MNGNDNMRSNGNDEKSVRLLSSPQSNPSARGAYLCLKQDFSEDVSSQKELKQLLQIFGGILILFFYQIFSLNSSFYLFNIRP